MTMTASDSANATSAREGEFAALIARLEAATGPDRELDHAIASELGSEADFERTADGALLTDGRGMTKQFTASIDAALTLVPTNHHLVELCSVREARWYASVAEKYTRTGTGPERVGHAPTPAIALCIAALKARATHQQQPERE